MRTSRRRPAGGPWSRARLLGLFLTAGLVLPLIVAGIGLAAGYALGPTAAPTDTGGAATPHTEPSAVRDQLAAEPMASVDAGAAFNPDPALDRPGAIRVPEPPVGRGPAGVPTGFPHTYSGAVGQLAAIEQVVLDQMSLPVARDVHAAWVADGGPGFAEWELTGNVRSFLAAGRQGGDVKDATTIVRTVPAAAMVKGGDGPDWVVACVLLDVTVVIAVEKRMGYGHCAAMAWDGSRWVVAPGPAPARAPSTWPGSVAAVTAGWLTWETQPGRPA